MSNIKKTLKEAREAINNKDYQTALKLCKSILKEEKDNYMALVFSAISLQEVGSDDQAPMAFKKAIQSNPTNLLAWNGLANYYEKKQSKEDCFKVYMKILELESNAKKIIDQIEKIIDLGDIVDRHKFVLTVQELLKRDDLESIRHGIRFNVSNFLARDDDAEEFLCKMHAEILEDLVENPNTVSNKHYNNYLKVLYKLGDYEKLLDSCQKMQNLYQNDLSPFDYISKVFVKLYVDDDKMVESFVEKAENASKRLLEENPQLTMGLLTKSILLYRASNVVEAKELLIQGDRLLTRL